MDAKNIIYVITLNQTPKAVTLVPHDPVSRYKTQQLQIQNVGKNKMMKTIIVNIHEVAKCMQLPHPSYLVTYLGYELNVTSHWFENKPAREQAVLAGQHSAETLNPHVLHFIEEFLLCKNCNLPELLIGVSKDGRKVLARCRGCPSQQEMNFQNDKFHRYIVNHPPAKGADAFKGNKTKKDEKQEKQEKGDKKAVQAQAEKKKTRKPRANPNAEEQVDDDDVEWFSDVSEEAVRARLEENVPKNLQAIQASAIQPQELREQIEKAANKAEAIAMFRAQTGLDADMLTVLLFDALYEVELPAPQFAKSFAESAALFAVTIASTPSAHLRLLEKIALYIGLHDGTIKYLPVVLQTLYSKDVVDETAIVQWHSSAGADLRAAAQPFVDWLQQAEEESDEE